MNYERLKKVVIAEDALDQRLLLKTFIEYLGLEVLSAEDGMVAREFIQQNSIDLLITDFVMPRMDGIELFHWCRSRSLNFPVIVFSSDSNLIDKRSLDCCSIILRSKPIDWGFLAAAIKAADRHRHEKDCAFRSFKHLFERELAGNP